MQNMKPDDLTSLYDYTGVQSLVLLTIDLVHPVQPSRTKQVYFYVFSSSALVFGVRYHPRLTKTLLKYNLWR